MAEIIIRDTGVGIPEKIINKIFNPFFTTKGERGTGLGLSMVYNIVTAHKGTIQVHSKFKKGTEFSICLPTTKRRPTNGDQPRESRNLIFEDVRLLVVDDEVELLDTMAEILKMKFKEVDIAGSGKEAIRRVKKNDYDIVLTDLGMPEMSGWEVAREIKKISQQVKVILVTGWGMQAEEELKHHHYVDKIISKPYELNVLLQTIQSLKQNSTQEATLV